MKILAGLEETGSEETKELSNGRVCNIHEEKTKKDQLAEESTTPLVSHVSK